MQSSRRGGTEVFNVEAGHMELLGRDLTDSMTRLLLDSGHNEEHDVLLSL